MKRLSPYPTKSAVVKLTGAAAVSAVVAVVIALAVVFAFKAWLLMLGLGVLHSIAPEVPALGFPQAMLAALGLSLVLSPFRRRAGE